MWCGYARCSRLADVVFTFTAYSLLVSFHRCQDPDHYTYIYSFWWCVSFVWQSKTEAWTKNVAEMSRNEHMVWSWLWCAISRTTFIYSFCVPWFWIYCECNICALISFLHFENRDKLQSKRMTKIICLVFLASLIFTFKMPLSFGFYFHFESKNTCINVRGNGSRLST